jgi:glucose/arabinose dehydrogenase
MAFDPDFTSNGYVYFFVTVSSSEQQIIRYTASGNIGTGKTTIVQDLPTDGENHDGGGIGFGADGMLYWGIGDLGNGTGVDNDLDSMAAKIGRARRDGSVPGDNPFADGPGGNADYIFARGFRNPFTLTFQPSTDLLWVNVVGTSYEQVFVVRSGGPRRLQRLRERPARGLHHAHAGVPHRRHARPRRSTPTARCAAGA